MIFSTPVFGLTVAVRTKETEIARDVVPSIAVNVINLQNKRLLTPAASVFTASAGVRTSHFDQGAPQNDHGLRLQTGASDQSLLPGLPIVRGTSRVP